MECCSTLKIRNSQISDEIFYDASKEALVPMGFCYPGKGKSGDLAPREECAPQWHHQLFNQLTSLKMTLLIGKYAQNYYLGDRSESTLTKTVQNYKTYLPDHFVLPHPSPRNNIWLKKNSWFTNETIPHLQEYVSTIIP